MMVRMNDKARASIVIAAAIAFARPVAFVAQEVGRAAQILADAREAIGDQKLAALKTFSVQSSVQRNLGNMQMPSDVEILLEMPDKFVRSDVMNGGPGMVIRGGGTTGFIGDKPAQKIDPGGASMGGVSFRMTGPNGSFSSPGGSGDKPTPEELEQRTRAMVRNSQAEASRLMLGWFAMAHPVLKAEYAYAGEAESPDGKAYVIDVKDAAGFAARLFIDEQNHLPLMVTYRGAMPRVMMNTNGRISGATDPSQPPEMADYTLYFEEWRDVDGIKFPFRMRRSTAGATNEEWTINKVKVNPKIDPKKFSGE